MLRVAHLNSINPRISENKNGNLHTYTKKKKSLRKQCQIRPEKKFKALISIKTEIAQDNKKKILMEMEQAAECARLQLPFIHLLQKGSDQLLIRNLFFHNV